MVSIMPQVSSIFFFQFIPTIFDIGYLTLCIPVQCFVISKKEKPKWEMSWLAINWKPKRSSVASHAFKSQILKKINFCLKFFFLHPNIENEKRALKKIINKFKIFMNFLIFEPSNIKYSSDYLWSQWKTELKFLKRFHPEV